MKTKKIKAYNNGSHKSGFLIFDESTKIQIKTFEEISKYLKGAGLERGKI